MTDKLHSLTVILEKPVRDDDVSDLISAIERLRGVSKVVVTPEDISTIVSLCATQQAREELRTKIAAVLWPPTSDHRR